MGLNSFRNSCTRRIVAAYGIFLFAGAGVAKATDTGILVRDVERLIELQQSIRQEWTQWEVQREALTRRHDLLQLEKSMLEARVDEAEQAAAYEVQAMAALEERLDLRDEILQKAGQLLAETELLAPFARETVPEGLRNSLPPPVPDATSILYRLQAVMNLTAAIHQLDQSITQNRQLMDSPDGGRRQFDVLYLGLSQAYAVSPDNRLAGHGFRHNGNWNWSWNPEWANPIRQAIRIHQNDLPPRWVRLPVAAGIPTRETE